MLQVVNLELHQLMPMEVRHQPTPELHSLSSSAVFYPRLVRLSPNEPRILAGDMYRHSAVIWNPFLNYFGMPLRGEDLQSALRALSLTTECNPSDASWTRVTKVGFVLLSELIPDMMSRSPSRPKHANVDEQNGGRTFVSHTLCRFLTHLSTTLADHQALRKLTLDELIGCVAVLILEIRGSEGRVMRILPTAYTDKCAEPVPDSSEIEASMTEKAIEAICRSTAIGHSSVYLHPLDENLVREREKARMNQALDSSRELSQDAHLFSPWGKTANQLYEFEPRNLLTSECERLWACRFDMALPHAATAAALHLRMSSVGDVDPILHLWNLPVDPPTNIHFSSGCLVDHFGPGNQEEHWHFKPRETFREMVGAELHNRIRAALISDNSEEVECLGVSSAGPD